MQQRINHLAVVVAAIVHFVLGGAWFTVFAKPWIAGLRMTPEQITYAQTHISPLPYAVAFLCNLLMAYALAWVVTRSGQQSIVRGVAIGFSLGVAVAAAAMVSGFSFEMKGPLFIAISAGYPVAGMTIMGGILGAWKRKIALPLASAAAGH